MSRFAAVVGWGKSGQGAAGALLARDWQVRAFDARGGQSLFFDDVAGVDVHVDDDPEALARAIVEVVTGVRQAPQLRRWMLPDLYGALACVHMSPCARGTRPVHVRTCPLDERTTEAAVIVSTVSRTYALALRLEEYHGRWITTALELA